MKHLLSLERLDVGRTLALTVGSPSVHRRGTTLKHVAFLLLFLIAGIGNVWGVDVTYTLTINGSDFNTTSYAANNNEKTTDAVCTTDNKKTYEVSWTSNQVMKNGNNMQWQKSKGYIYNSTDLGTISSVTVNSSAGSFTTYYGTSEQPSSGSAGSGNGYFKTSVGGATGTTSSIIVTFVISEGGGGSQEPTVSASPEAVNNVVAAGVNNQSISLSYENISGYTTEVSVHPNADGTGTLSPAWLSASISSPYSTVSYTVSANNGAARTAYIKVHATASGNKEATTIIPVSQVKYTEPTGTFAAFTGSIVEGDYLIVYDNGAINTTSDNSSRMQFLPVTPQSNKVTNPDESIIWHIAPSGDYWTIYNAAENKYLAATGTKSQATLNADGTDNKSLWTVTGTSTYEFVNKNNSTNNVNANLRKNGTYGFACYASGTGGALTLYKKALPTHKVTFTAAPTGGTVAVSVGGSSINTNADVEEGNTVTITPMPSAYYSIASVTKGGQAVTPEQGVYSFTMPASDVAIVVTFELIPVTNVTLNKSALELVEGATETLSVTSVLPNTARNTVTWSSSNTDVATVTNEGVVTAVAAGDATIKATSTVTTSVFGSCEITVTAPSGNPITLLQNEGGTVTASVDVSDVIKETSVTLTATPEEGYSVSGWTVLDGNAVEITPTAQTANTFTFSMPDGEVTAEASFTHEEAVLKLHDAAGITTYDEGNDHFWKESVTLPSTAAACSKTFMGWSADENRSTAPEIAKGANYTIPNKGENHLYAVYATQGEGITTWTEAALGDLTASDIFVIVGNNDSNYAMTNDNGTSNPPAATSVTIANSKITSDVADNMKWNISGDAKDGYSFYPNGSTTTWLYCINTNNGVRVGTNENKLFVIDDGYLKNSGTSRYVGVYNSSDWRCYTPIHDNIKNQTFKFYKRTVEGGSYSGYTTSCQPVLSAPTFSVEAGTYYESKSITLSATNDADIYYTLDGSEPTTGSTKFTSAISLSARGTTTIKAIAVKEGFETSEVAEATYTINLPFATVGDLFSYLEENSLTELNDVIVTGVVTKIVTEYSSQHKNVSINIADDFDSNSPQLEGYRTKDATGVTAASVVAVGDKVTLKGNYTYFQSTTHELAADNTIEEYTAKVLSSVTVGGTASKTAYSEEDNQFSFAGLTATANYSNTGYSKDVTNEVTWKANEEETYTVTEGGDVNVTATLSDVTSEPKVVAVTYTTKTVASLRLEYASTYTFVGFDLPKPKVYASYVEDIPEEEVTELLTDDNYDTEDAYNKDEAGNYTITVEYKSKETTYSVTVKAIYNTQETAHSVADAIEIIKKSTYTSTSADPTAMYVHGVVSGVGSINSGKLGYYINDTESTDGQLQVYQGLYFESESFTNDNILAVGDEVIIEGHMLYFSSTTPELKLSPLVYLLKKALPTISVEDVDELEVGQADLDITELITKQGNGVVSLESGDLEKLTVDGLTLHAVGAGDVTVTANLAATDNTGSINYKANSTTFNVHVIAARTRYTVTFDANGADGGSAPEAIANQLEGAPVDLPECTYTWAHHGFTGWKVINLSTSAEIEIENNQFTMPAANVKIQAQWEEIATTHIVFNVNGNTETVEAVDVPQAVEYSITQVTDGQNGYEFFGWAESEQAEDVEEAIATIERYTPEAGEASKTLYAVFKRVDEGAPKTDVLTAADLKATDTQYKDFSNVSKTSNAKYAGNSAKDSNGNIQLRSNNSNSGIVSTTSGGILKSVKINVASGSNTIDVYGSNTAYNAASDLYATGNNANQGTKIGSTSSTATINAEADYKFVGIRSNNGAIYLSSVEIVWQPKTTYYTTAPSAVYAVSYDLGEGAWAGEACDGANVKAGQTFDICESVPVREHYKFNGWTAGGNVVSGTITINAETAITAVWEPKVENDITYNAGTGSGSDAVVGNNEEGAEIVLPSAADKSLSKEGYDFVGWLYGGDLYEAGTTFEMPASAVTFVAQWKKQNVVKMSLITDASQLMNGMEVIFGYIDENDADKNAVNGDITGTNKFFTSVTSNVTFNNDNTVTFGSGAMVLTIEKADGGWKLRKNATNYLTNSGDNLSWNSKGNATTWTISFEDNNAKIATGSVWIQYNSSSPRFKTYSSTQKAIQLYGKAVVVSENVNISDLGYVEGDVIVVSSGATLTMDAPSAPASITVKENAVVNVSAATEAGTVIVEKGAKLAIEEGGSVTTDEPLVLYTTLGKGTGTNTSGNAPGSSSEIINAERLNATGDVYLEIELTQDAKASAGWYAFSVPFPVDAMNGVYYGDTKLTNEVGYAIMSHYGELRAKDEYAWKKFRGIMQPGVFYVITVGNTDYKTLRFKKVADEALVASSSVAVSPFPTQTGNNADGAWNGIGNPNLAISNLYTSVSVMQFYDHKSNTFIGRSHSVNLVVGSAFFIQYNGGETVSIPVGTTGYEGVLAPRREQKAVEEMIYEVQLTNVATGELEDNVFLTAREDATNEYEIGRDVAKLSMGTAKCAQMWVPAYGTKLCAADFQLVNDKAEYPLTLNAPSAGTYSISMMENDAATIYLTYEGNIIWNLSESAYPIDMKKGTTEGYGLLLNAKMPMTPTGVETIDNSQFTIHNCQKVIIDEHVYILRGGQMYDVTGKAVK